MPFVSDGTTDWSLGQDSWLSPNQIRPNQYAAGVNLSTRGGVLGPRSPYHRFEMGFAATPQIETDYHYQRSLEAVWSSGKFQACIGYSYGSDDFLISVVCGLIFRTNIRTNKTILLSDKIRVNQYAPRINCEISGKSVVLHDYPDYPVLITGDTVARSDPEHMVNGFLEPQVPISVLGAANQNRLFIANASNEFTAGDPIGNKLTPEAPNTFTEVLVPSAPFFNQFFELSTGSPLHPISAMGFIQQLDTSTGVGPLFVSTQNQIYTYQSQLPRTSWDANFGALYIATAGIAGPRGFINVNSDVIFLSGAYNVHAFSNARNDARTWGNVPISREVNNYLKSHDKDLNQFAVLGFFNNRIFISTNPYRVGALDRSQRPVTDYAHGGFVTLEIEALASFLSQGTPTWDGLWTGVNPMEIQTIAGRCFVVSKDGSGPNGVNVMYELSDKNFGSDILRNGTKRQVRSIIYTREYSFVDQSIDSQFMEKKENVFSVQLQNVQGEFSLDIDRRPSHFNDFIPLGHWDHSAPSQLCDGVPDKLLNGIAPHQFKPIIFGDGQTACEPITEELNTAFIGLQYRMIIEGENWNVQKVKSKAEVLKLQELNSDIICKELPDTRLPVQCSPDWIIPGAKLC